MSLHASQIQMLRQIIRKQEAELLEARLAGAMKEAVPTKHEQEGEEGGRVWVITVTSLLSFFPFGSTGAASSSSCLFS